MLVDLPSASLRVFGQLQRRPQVGRQRRAHVDRHAGDRVVEREPLRMQELALEPVAARDPVLRGRRTRDDRSPPGGRGSGGCDRSPGSPAAAPPSAAGARSRSGSGLRAVCRYRSTSVPGRAGHVRSERRSSPSALTGGRRPGPAYSRRSSLRASSAFSARCTSSFLATTSSPGRVTVQPVHDPGAPGLFAAGRDALERLGERPRPVAPRGMHDDPGGLVDHQQVLVLVGDREIGLRAVGRPSAGSRCATTISSPPLTVWRLGRTRPSTRTRSESIRP